MRRREFIGASAAVLAFPTPVAAQGRDPKLVGVLFGIASERAAPFLDAFRSGMQESGLVEGQDFRLSVRHSDGYNDRLPELARDLVAANPRVIVTGSTASTLAVVQASPITPVVCAAMFDPAGRGLAENDARPGGQVTGLHWSIESLPGKQLETIREIVPGARNIGLLVEWRQRGNFYLPPVLAAAQAMGLEITSVEVRAPEDLQSAFESLSERGAQAVLVLGGSSFLSEHRRIIALAAERRWPVLAGWREFVESGALISYAVNLRESFRRCAYYVERIFRGEKAGELPIELSRLELVINLQTAKALGLMIPPTLLARADEVIE